MVTKRGKKGHKKTVVVKHLHLKRVILAILFALVGTLTAVYAYQYTYSAKLQTRYEQIQKEIETKNKSLLQTNTDKANLQKQVEELNKLKSDLEAQLQAKKAEKIRIASVAIQTAQAAPVNGSCVDWMVQAGIPVTNATTNLILRESGCRITAMNPSSGACGIPQALPCSKLANSCPNWQNDPVCQLRWMDNYVKNRYGTWENAYGTWLSRSPHWY